MWIVYVSVLLNLLSISLEKSLANRPRHVRRHPNYFTLDTLPLTKDDYRTVGFLFDLFDIQFYESVNSLQKINGKQTIRVRRAVKQQNRQQNKSSEQQFKQQTVSGNTTDDHSPLIASRNTAGHVTGPTTRLLDGATDDRAQLQQHYQRLKVAKEDKNKKSDNAKDKPKKFESQLKRLQGVGVRGQLMCGSRPLAGTKIKLVDMDPKPDRDDLMAETRTDANGLFHLSGATREESDIEVILKIYHDCLDEEKECQRKSTWRVPSRYHNNGTLTEWFDVGTVNMELSFIGEERDCRH